MQLVLRALIKAPELVVTGPENTQWVNAIRFADLPMRKVRDIMRGIIEEATRRAEANGGELFSNRSFKELSDDAIGLLPNPKYDYSTIDTILKAITEYQRNTARVRPAGRPPARRVDGSYPAYNTDRHPALVRYGNVELRVLENFLTNGDELFLALKNLIARLNDEEKMYSESQASGYLVSDDYDWNLRRLMTNAGFYVEPDFKSAQKCLEEWSTRYLIALRNAHLVWHNNFLPYFMKVELANYRLSRAVPKFATSPGIFQIYDTFAGNDVLVVSPLAELIRQQMDSRRIFQLYSGYEVPAFSLRAIPAWVSTWPNRPHSNWRETFSRLCDAVLASYSERPFTVFTAACGCYGLPLCDFVRQEIGCKVLYLGNFMHVAFGIRQQATRDFMPRRVNSEMWVDSDLAKYKNMSRIDGGRYIC